MKRMIFNGLLLMLCLPFIAFAEIPKQVIQDFSPISGKIIMPVGDEYLIDLDASNDIHEGDIFTIIMKSEKIIQPDTKQVVGAVERPKGFLQVTKIKSGYSYTKLLTADINPVKGDQIKRYSQVPALFEGSSEAVELNTELKRKLPQLAWISPEDTAKPELIFSLSEKSLNITDSSGTLLKSYSYQDGKLVSAASGIYHPDNFQLGEAAESNKSFLNQAAGNLGEIIGLGTIDKRLENPGIIQKQKLNEGIWIGPNLRNNPVGLAIADLDGDGQQEIAVALEDHLQIYRLEGGKQILIATINFSAGVHLLTLDSIDLDKNGIPELYLSANIDTILSSQVVEFVDGQYKNTRSRLPWFFRTVSFPDEGRVLLAQRLGDEHEKPFDTPVFRMTSSNDGPIRGEQQAIPPKIKLLSFTPFSGEKNDLLYAAVNSRDRLFVATPKGSTIWESTEKFNGSDVFFTSTPKADSDLNEPVYIEQRLLTLPTGEILAAQNEGTRLFDRYRNFDKSRIIALKWNGAALRQEWSTSEQEGYLADFAVADADNDGQDELVMVVKYKHKNLLQKGKSNIVIYELNHDQQAVGHQEPPKK